MLLSTPGRHFAPFSASDVIDNTTFGRKCLLRVIDYARRPSLVITRVILTRHQCHPNKIPASKATKHEAYFNVEFPNEFTKLVAKWGHAAILQHQETLKDLVYTTNEER